MQQRQQQMGKKASTASAPPTADNGGAAAAAVTSAALDAAKTADLAGAAEDDAGADGAEGEGAKLQRENSSSVR